MMDFKEVRNELYDYDVAITEILCLGLLLPCFYSASLSLENITEELEAEEFATLFGLDLQDTKSLWDNDSDRMVLYGNVLDTRTGFVLRGMSGCPKDIVLDSQGNFSSGTGCIWTPFIVYADSLECAVKNAVEQADAIHENAIEAQRRKQGLPEHGGVA